MKANELRKKLVQGEDILLLDVREPDEFQKGTIESAVNMPMGKVFVEESRGNLPKDKKIIAFCRTGGRCGIVARELKTRGYDIEAVEDDWIEE